jgi:hypothetical protein
MKNPKNLPARYPNAGSFVAGLLIGLSILIPVFGMVVELGDWQALWVLGAPISLAFGVALQAFITVRPRPRHPGATLSEPGALHITGMRLSLER